MITGTQRDLRGNSEKKILYLCVKGYPVLRLRTGVRQLMGSKTQPRLCQLKPLLLLLLEVRAP